MAETLTLTKDPRALGRIVDKHVEREESRLQWRRLMWLLAWYYLNGARRFDVFDPTTGRIEPHFVSKEGNMEFQCQELLYTINQVVGRLQGMDVRPKVGAVGTTLETARNRAVTQVILDSAVGGTQIDQVKKDFAYLFTTLGSCGITGYVIDHPTIGLTTDLEVVHPKELFPFPSLQQDHTKQRGIVRQRMVPMDFLEDKFGKKSVRDNLNDLDWWEVDAGSPTGFEEDEMLGIRLTGDYHRLGGGDAGPRYKAETIAVCRVRELWLDGPRGTCQRYVVTSGEYLFDDIDFSGQEMYCPLGFARFMESGTFHGLGMFDIMFPIARQMELLLSSLFNNIRDTDRYGVLVIPNGQFDTNTMLRDVGRGLRVLPWEPDPVTEGFRPFAIQPFNLGDVPGKVATFARQLMQNLNPSPDLAAEKGRIDSFQGLQFLDEQLNRAMTNPSSGLEQAWGCMYRGVAAQMARSLVVSPRAIPVSQLTLDLAGAVIDPKKSEVSFSENPIPDLSRLSFSVRQINPRSEAARKAEALELHQRQIQDTPSLILFSIQEGLNFAMFTDEEEAAVETVTRNILLLYGDGNTPGQVILTPQTAKPDIQLRVLSSFMARPIMGLASPTVQDEFKRYRETLLQFSGLVLPPGIPNPDDFAMLSQGTPQPMAGMSGQPQLTGAPNG